MVCRRTGRILGRVWGGKSRPLPELLDMRFRGCTWGTSSEVAEGGLKAQWVSVRLESLTYAVAYHVIGCAYFLCNANETARSRFNAAQGGIEWNPQSTFGILHRKQIFTSRNSAKDAGNRMATKCPRIWHWHLQCGESPRLDGGADAAARRADAGGKVDVKARGAKMSMGCDVGGRCGHCFSYLHGRGEGFTRRHKTKPVGSHPPLAKDGRVRGRMRILIILVSSAWPVTCPRDESGDESPQSKKGRVRLESLTYTADTAQPPC